MLFYPFYCHTHIGIVINLIFLQAFVGLVLTFELWMVPMFTALIILYQFILRWVGFKNYETWVLGKFFSSVSLKV